MNITFQKLMQLRDFLMKKPDWMGVKEELVKVDIQLLNSPENKQLIDQ